MNVNIFKCQSYKEFLLKVFDDPALGKGQRTQLAKYLGCQTGFISQVINGDRQFSLEHLVEIAEFYELGMDERNFLMLMGQFERSGSEKLQHYFKNQLEDMRISRQRLPLSQARPMKERDLVFYHSKWFHHAIHELYRVKRGKEVEPTARLLGISTDNVEKALSFLTEIGALEEKDQRFVFREINNSIGRDFPYINNVHKDFRLEAIRSLDRRKPVDSHYSRFLVASDATIALIQEEVAEFVNKMNAILDAPDKEEKKKLYSYCSDLFSY